jgi:preprotein translocase subunit YajC
MDGLILLAIMFGALYAFMIRPQQRRQKEHVRLLSSLEEGDMVMTNGGIYGAIAEVEGDIVWLEVAPEVELKIMKSSIADRAPDVAAADDVAATDDDDEAADAAEKGEEG